MQWGEGGSSGVVPIPRFTSSGNVASGSRAFVVGGSTNTASGDASVVLGGSGNSATTTDAIVPTP